MLLPVTVAESPWLLTGGRRHGRPWITYLTALPASTCLAFILTPSSLILARTFSPFEGLKGYSLPLQLCKSPLGFLHLIPSTSFFPLFEAAVYITQSTYIAPKPTESFCSAHSISWVSRLRR